MTKKTGHKYKKLSSEVSDISERKSPLQTFKESRGFQASIVPENHYKNKLQVIQSKLAQDFSLWKKSHICKSSPSLSPEVKSVSKRQRSQAQSGLYLGKYCRSIDSLTKKKEAHIKDSGRERFPLLKKSSKAGETAKETFQLAPTTFPCYKHVDTSDSKEPSSIVPNINVKLDVSKITFPQIPCSSAQKGWGSQFSKNTLLSSIIKLQNQRINCNLKPDCFDITESLNDAVHGSYSDISVYDHMGPGTRGKRNKMQVSNHRSKAYTENHSYVNLSSSYVSMDNVLGELTTFGADKPIQNSRSFHGNGCFEQQTGVTSRAGAFHRHNAPTSTALRQQQHHRKMVERQRMKALKPLTVSMTHEKMTDNPPISTPILPDANSTSFRLGNNVSFDEGCRYNGDHGTFSGELKASGGSRTKKLPAAYGAERVSTSAHESTNGGTHPGSSNEVAYDGPPVRHPSFTVPSQTRRHSDRPGYLASPAGSPMLAGAATATPTFRLQKEQRPSWNYRLSANDLSVNGGSYSGPPGGSHSTTKVNVGNLSLNPTSNPITHRMTAQQLRDKNNASHAKARMASRYGCRYDPSNKDFHMSYADPFVAAPTSFQQRLSEISMLESDTIKYERNRKLKRKKNNVDKDS